MKIEEIEKMVRQSRCFPKETIPLPCGRKSFYYHACDNLNKTGMILEFGVFEGGTINFLAEILSDRIVFGFDSFMGLPSSWPGVVQQGYFSLNGRLPQVRENVDLIVGNFDRTLHEFLMKNDQKISLVHIDCDLYSSSAFVLYNLANRLEEGSVIIFDELLNYNGYENHEIKAFSQIISIFNLKVECIGWVDEPFVRCAFRIL